MSDTRRPELDTAIEAAVRWLDSLPEREIPAGAGIDAVEARLAGPLPRTGREAEAVVRELIATVEPGLMATGSPRFYGWVMGGTLPVALAADWLVCAWDQPTGMRDATPGVIAVEEAAGRWIVDALRLPTQAGVGFVTGCTMANFTGLASGRDEVLRRAGWDVARDGLAGAPRVRVLVGAERHGSVDLALRYLGLGAPEVVAADRQGRLEADALRSALAGHDGPTLVCAQAGNIHSGAFDPFDEICQAAHEAGAWVHVDGAFGLWAAASPALAHLVPGLAQADSWATDAHKTLNTPYDCGLAVVADRAALIRSFGHQADYLLAHSLAPDPHELVPELSRRARGVPVWAALAHLGRDGLAGLVDGLVRAAAGIATGLADLGLDVLNDVVYTQVTCAAADDATTEALLAALLTEGTIRPSASRWQGRTVIRFSVSNHGTDDRAVRQTIDAVRRALTGPS